MSYHLFIFHLVLMKPLRDHLNCIEINRGGTKSQTSYRTALPALAFLYIYVSSTDIFFLDVDAVLMFLL